MANMRDGGIDAHYRPPGVGGFTDLILQRGADALLRS
jgi:hypothetical protein